MVAAAMSIRTTSANEMTNGRRDESDTALIARCQAGEREAFSLLLHRYRDRVVNLAYQLMNKREDAEDVAQDAFTQAFTSIKSFRGESQFFTWIYRITVNLCLQRRRRQRPEESTDEYELSTTQRVEDQVVTKMLVERTLSRMSEPLRVALVLRDMQDLSYEEVAGVLNIPIGTVRSRLNEARRQFREAWFLAEREVN